MVWCEANGVHFLFGLVKNDLPNHASVKEMRAKRSDARVAFMVLELKIKTGGVCSALHFGEHKLQGCAEAIAELLQ